MQAGVGGLSAKTRVFFRFAESTFPVFKFMMPRLKYLGMIAYPGRFAVMIVREKGQMGSPAFDTKSFLKCGNF